MGEVVQARRAGPETSEVESDQTQKAGVRGDVVGGEVELLGDGAMPAAGPGQSWHSSAPWCGSWRGSPREAHAVAGGEEKSVGV